MSVLRDSVIVTGAGSGIGQAAAAYFYDIGAKVVAVDLKSDGLNALAGDIVRVIGDVSKTETCKRAVVAALEVAPLRGLFNCAGLELHRSAVTMSEKTMIKCWM